jgi:hypothetical protein
MLKAVHFQLPVSLLTVATVEMQGMYKLAKMT